MTRPPPPRRDPPLPGRGDPVHKRHIYQGNTDSIRVRIKTAVSAAVKVTVAVMARDAMSGAVNRCFYRHDHGNIRSSVIRTATTASTVIIPTQLGLQTQFELSCSHADRHGSVAITVAITFIVTFTVSVTTKMPPPV